MTWIPSPSSSKVSSRALPTNNFVRSGRWTSPSGATVSASAGSSVARSTCVT